MPVDFAAQFRRGLKIFQFYSIEFQQEILGIFVAGVCFEVGGDNLTRAILFPELQVNLGHTPQRGSVNDTHCARNFGQVL